MSETGWLSLATIIIGFLNGAFLIYMKVKTGQQLDEHTKLDQAVQNNTDHIIQQNTAQTAKLAEVHADINGRVAQLIDSKVHEHIGAAVAIAVANALKEEREQQAVKVKQDAKDLIEVAREAAADLKQEKK